MVGSGLAKKPSAPEKPLLMGPLDLPPRIDASPLIWDETAESL
jgi:hypothetical protein